jgi:hypothetical protein
MTLGIVLCPKCQSPATRPVWQRDSLVDEFRESNLVSRQTPVYDVDFGARHCLYCEMLFPDPVPWTRKQFAESASLLLSSFQLAWEQLLLEFGSECEKAAAHNSHANYHDIDDRELRALQATHDLWSKLEAIAQPFCHYFVSGNLYPFYGDASVYTQTGTYSIIPLQEVLARRPGQPPFIERCRVCNRLQTVPVIPDEEDPGEGIKGIVLWKLSSQCSGTGNRTCLTCSSQWTSDESRISVRDLHDPLIVLFGKTKPTFDRRVLDYGRACFQHGGTQHGTDERRVSRVEKMHAYVRAVTPWARLEEGLRRWANESYGMA